jgi:hypothetical protein
MTLSRSLIAILLPFFSFGQSSTISDKAVLTDIYSQAIRDFIKAANQKNKKPFDTLFFGKGVVGQPGMFPDIKLPETIEKTTIKLITPEEGEKYQKDKPFRIYINMPGWVDKKNAEFIFVVFSDGFRHQYDYTLRYVYIDKLKKFALGKIEFKGPPFK